MAEEIALFIDFENIRYSMLNTQHREPDPQELINVARRYGTVMVAKAYADWTRQPEMFKGSLMAAMIDRVDCPAKQRDRYRGSQWQPNGAAAPGWTGLREDQPPGWSTSSTSATTEAADEEPESDETTPDTGETTVEMSTSQIRPVTPTWSGPATQAPPQYGSQSTVDLNMLMDIIETVFDRPTISTFVLMTGDRDFTRICARLKLRLNKFVVVAGVPGTVSRDLTAAANQFVLIGNHTGYNGYGAQTLPHQTMSVGLTPTDPQFLQFLDYIDRHWAWRTVIGVSNFIGDPYNHKNRFRGRLTRESARELLQTCIKQGVLLVQTDELGNEDLRLNRDNPDVAQVLAAVQQMQQSQPAFGQPPSSLPLGPGQPIGPSQPVGPGQQLGPGPYSQMGPWTQGYGGGVFARRAPTPMMAETADEDEDDADDLMDDEDGEEQPEE